MTKERAAKIILDMINGAESTFGHSLSTTEIIALKKAYCALNPEPTTNADRIRAMIDEEIADFLASQTRIGASWWMDWLKLDPIDWTKREEDGKDE